ncbi:hypothetical protein GCM10027519_12810 [Kineococcus endophyticus]
MRIDSRIAKANAAPSVAVKVAVWVMKPGPMADVAMRKIAPTTGPRPGLLRVVLSDEVESVAVLALSWAGRSVMGAPGDVATLLRAGLPDGSTLSPLVEEHNGADC